MRALGRGWPAEGLSEDMRTLSYLRAWVYIRHPLSSARGHAVIEIFEESSEFGWEYGSIDWNMVARFKLAEGSYRKGPLGGQ